jgi:hypothetical protein
MAVHGHPIQSNGARTRAAVSPIHAHYRSAATQVPSYPLRPVSPLESDRAAPVVRRGSTFPRLKQLTVLIHQTAAEREPRQMARAVFHGLSAELSLAFRATCGNFSWLGMKLGFSVRRENLLSELSTKPRIGMLATRRLPRSIDICSEVACPPNLTCSPRRTARGA